MPIEVFMGNMPCVSPSTSATCPVTKPCSPLVHHKTSDDPASSNSSRSIDTSSSTPEFRRGKRGRHTLPLKNRSRSVFIRLQLPNARTPPLPHRNLSILGESDSSDTDIQTAPVVESTGAPFFLYESNRRASDGVSVDKRLDFSDIKSPQEEPLPSPHTHARARVSSDRPGTTNSAGRRGSFIHLSDADDEDQQNVRSRASSMNSHIGDETYITPFAQILANLHHIRHQFLSLFSLPPETRTSQTKVNPRTLPSPLSSPPKKLSEGVQMKLAMQTLEEFDWCLKKLESVNSASMGTMAQDKFRRILSRELSHMTGKSRAGDHVAEWVQNITNPDDGSSMVDRALDTSTIHDDTDDINDTLYLQEARMSGSLVHDVWSKMKHRTTSTSSVGGSVDYCIRVPMFGVHDSNMDKTAMREFMVHQMDAWDVDTFHLDTISAGNALVSASYLIFKKRDLFSTFKISPHAFINFMSEIQRSYLPNPYHNQVHGADVLLATNYLLKSEALKGVFTDLEILAALVAAAIHDVGHPARTNQFLVNVQHDLAVLYNDNSVLENHHLALAFKVLQDPKCNFIQNFESDQRQAFRKMAIDMVLATDMSKHFKHLGDLKTLLETQKVANDGILQLDKYSDRSEVLQCMIHCADLSNPTKREDLAANWSRRIMEENFLQGDEEKSLGIPLNPLGDREQVSLCKCQVTFIDFIVDPLWETWAELVYPDGQLMLDNIAKTREYWHTLVDPNSPPPSDESGSEEINQTNGPRENCSGERVNEVAILDDSPATVTCTVLSSVSSEAKYSTNVLKSFSGSPLSDRRTSFQKMKKLKAVQDSADS
ncbi:3',5'-cyclic-AMP phosphodiesterase 4C-like isoform X3 [Halichondria panicea]|uniref:3',5'-cyclic-AMP phosphodiesterase 4C-like isoform X3 n=1 Tax=Halichondria panicea TaxID=6063 RepID=UPI00312B89D1